MTMRAPINIDLPRTATANCSSIMPNTCPNHDTVEPRFINSKDSMLFFISDTVAVFSVCVQDLQNVRNGNAYVILLSLLKGIRVASRYSVKLASIRRR